MISIIIVTYKSKDFILPMIKSIFEHIHDFEIIVVDNDSKDGACELIKELYPKVKVIENLRNVGYAKGMNIGYKQSKGEYLAFMNPDMKSTGNPFPKLMEKLNEDKSIGIISPQLKYEDGEIQPNVKRNPDLLSQLLILLKLHHFFKTDSLKKYLAKDFDYSKGAYVEQLMGAFIFTKRDRFEKFGPWDESYPLWWEDVQLCKDSLDSGFKNYYLPVNNIIHFEGKSFEQVMTTVKQERFNKGMRIYFLKNYGPLYYLILLILHPVSIGLARIVQFLKIKPKTQSKL